MTERAWPGRPFPLGATWDGEGTNFSLFSMAAEGVDVCLFDERGHEARIALEESTYHVWHGFLPEVGAGQRYGYRVRGPFEPALPSELRAPAPSVSVAHPRRKRSRKRTNAGKRCPTADLKSGIELFR